MEASSNNDNIFLQSCNNCGKCTNVCPYLLKYGGPQQIIRERSSSVFLCTNCGACDVFCPASLSPSHALFQLKVSLIKEGKFSESVKNAIKKAKIFVYRGHSYPFVYYDSCDVAFFPGCSLSGTNPKLVKKCLGMLKSVYGRVGLVLDCCFDPLFQNGLIDEVKGAVERIKKRLDAKGIKKLIVGCTNCKKIFKLHLPELEVKHILEVISISEMVEKNKKDEIYLHHPCPTFRFKELQRKVDKSLRLNFEVKEGVKHPLCCGAGGLSHILSLELSDEFSDRFLEKAKDVVVVTYCMGCKNRFLKRGKKTYHILELFNGVKPLEKPISSVEKWINRLHLSFRMRFFNRKFLIALLLLIAITTSFYLQKEKYLSLELVLNFIKAHKIIAPFIYILLYTIGPSIFLPSLPMTIGAGFIWGPFFGVLYSITGATLGASFSFLLSRYLIGDAIRMKFGYERWWWLKGYVEKHGWKAVAFARLLPILPFPVLNYLFGVTPIPFFQYFWSTFVFMLPACIIYVVFGSTMELLFFAQNTKTIVTGILSVSILMVFLYSLKNIFKKFFLREK